MSSKLPRRRVMFLTAGLFHYRRQLHVLLKEMLENEGVAYTLAVSPPKLTDQGKEDFSPLPFAVSIRDSRFRFAGRELIYQHALKLASSQDLVILTQEAKFLLNFILAALPHRIRPTVALFGHGRNFQPDDTLWCRLSESVKRRTTGHFDWWFAHNRLACESMIGSGADPRRVTNVRNSIDTRQLRADLRAVPGDLETISLRDRQINTSRLCLFIGSLYKEKRLDFLVAAADRIRARDDAFELVVAGDGPLSPDLRDAAATRPWLHAVGSVYGQEKAVLMKNAKLLLIPGAVGLIVLDSFATGLPLVTTEASFHGPEIDYLENGVNGIIAGPADDLSQYADTVAMLLQSDSRLRCLSKGASEAAENYSIEEMARRFKDGIIAALDWSATRKSSG